MDKKQLDIVKKTSEELFTLLGITSPFEVAQIDESIELVLETEENGILIGYHGETLEALQLILSLAIAKKTGNFIRVSLEVGEYKKNRMEYLKNLTDQTKEQVLSERRGISLPNLKSWERRFVHMLLQEDTEVMTESAGVGRDRVLTIYPKQ